MPREVVVVFVHGIAVENTGYSRPLQTAIVKQLDRMARVTAGTERASEYVDFREVFWADVVRGHQTNYLGYAERTAGLKPTWMHTLVVQGLGDAAAYQKTQRFKNSAYYKIQKRLRDRIGEVAAGKTDCRPMIIVAHSLGCQIVSTYAWDLHRYKAPDAKARLIKALQDGAPDDSADSETKALYAGNLAFIDSLTNKSPFERLDTLAGLVTVGCNIPLFTFTFGPHSVFPITQTDDETMPPPFPGQKLDWGAQLKARWLNYYSLNDPLGYPLKPLSTRYESERLLSDHQVMSEGRWRGTLMRALPWARPLIANAAHQGYWRNREVARGAASLISDIVHSDTAMPHPMFEA